MAIILIVVGGLFGLAISAFAIAVIFEKFDGRTKNFIPPPKPKLRTGLGQLPQQHVNPPKTRKSRKKKAKKVAKKGWRAIDEPFEPQIGKWQEEE